MSRSQIEVGLRWLAGVRPSSFLLQPVSYATNRCQIAWSEDDREFGNSKAKNVSVTVTNVRKDPFLQEVLQRHPADLLYDEPEQNRVGIAVLRALTGRKDLRQLVGVFREFLRLHCRCGSARKTTRQGSARQA